MTDYNLFNQTGITATASGAGNAGVNGLHFTVSTACTLDGVWHYSPSASPGSQTQLPTTIALYTTQSSPATGTLVTSNTATWLTGPGGSAASAGSGWCYAAFTSPPSLSSGVDYMAAQFRNDSTNGWFIIDEPYSWPALNGILTAPDDVGSGQGWFVIGTSLAFPSGQLAGYNWGMDVQVTTSSGVTSTGAVTLGLAVAGAALAGVTSSGAVKLGLAAAGTVTVANPVTSTGAVTLDLATAGSVTVANPVSATGAVKLGLAAAGSAGSGISAAGAVTLSLAAAGTASVPVLPFPSPATQLDVRLEVNAGGTWVNVTSDCDHGPWAGGRGHPDESTTVSPSTFDATLTNTAARYSPDNPMSDLWPWCVQNMPGRASIPAAQNYLRLEANASDRAFVATNSTISVTGSLEMRIALRLSDWQGCVLAERYDNSQPSWFWLLNGDGTMTFSWFDSGGTQHSLSSDVPLPSLSGDFALKVTLDATSSTVTWYTAPSIDGTYTQVGDAGTLGGGTTVRAGNASLVVGWSNNLASPQMFGRVYEYRLYSGIAGTVVADGVFSAQAAGAVSWTDSAGNTWNVSGGGEISSRNYRSHFEASEWPQEEPEYNPDAANNTSVAVDALVPLVGGGLLRRYSQRAPNVQSAMSRAILAQTGSLAPVAYWPMEDQAGSSSFGSAVGGPAMTWLGGPPVLADSSAFTCSDALPGLGGAALHGYVASYAAGGGAAWTVRFLADIPSLPASNQVLLQVDCVGGLASYITFVVNSDGTVALTAYAADNVTVIAGTGNLAWTGGIQQPLLWSIEAQPSGSDVQYSLVSLAPGAASALSASATSSTAGPAGYVAQALPAPYIGIWTDAVIGHLQVQYTQVSLFVLAGALQAHLAEAAGTRFARLCAENGIQCRIRGNAADTVLMGVQPAGTLTTLLQACADADQGVWTELRQQLGWGYVTRKALYNQPATATVSYLLDLLSMWSTAPTRDDQTIVNDVTFTNDTGSTYRMTAAPGQPVTGGRMSTAAPASGGIGTYAQTYSVSVASDGQLPDLCGWKLNIGTVDQARLPGIVLDLANEDAAAVFYAILDLDLGDRLVISSPPRRLGFNPVTQIVQAVTETLFYDTLTIGIAGVPELPYEVFQLDGAMRIAPPAAVLSAGVTTTATSWSVAASSTDSTQLWSTTPGDYPQNWMVDGEEVTCTAMSGSSSPQTATVTRSVNGVVKSHLASAAVTMWPPSVIGL